MSGLSVRLVAILVMPVVAASSLNVTEVVEWCYDTIHQCNPYFGDLPDGNMPV